MQENILWITWENLGEMFFVFSPALKIDRLCAMSYEFLDFERPIAELKAKIKELHHMSADSDLNISEEIERLEGKGRKLTEEIFSKLTAAQIVQLARHPERPYTLDYIGQIFTDFDELHGDRHTSRGTALVGGIARLDGQPVMVIGHQKGRSAREKMRRNFGMPCPEEYRKALRLMQMAEKFQLPIFTFIDTPGAYPGVGAEQRNQSEAIARNLLVMSDLKVPIICTVIGEGGSGGALAIGVGDCTMMCQYSVYSVISPEGCASILWKSAERARDAAEAMGVTASKLFALGLVDKVVAEPLGGAHRDIPAMGKSLKASLSKQLEALQTLPIEDLLTRRYERLRSFGI